MITVSMDSSTHSAQVVRLEGVDSGRRRGRGDEEKPKNVLESLAAPRHVSATALPRVSLVTCRTVQRRSKSGTAESS